MARCALARYWKLFEDINAKKCHIPVQPNHEFKGIPLHISTSELRDVRAFIMDVPFVKKLASHDNEKVPAGP